MSEKYRKDLKTFKIDMSLFETLDNEESVTLDRLKRYISRIPELKDNAHTI